MKILFHMKSIFTWKMKVVSWKNPWLSVWLKAIPCSLALPQNRSFHGHEMVSIKIPALSRLVKWEHSTSKELIWDAKLEAIFWVTVCDCTTPADVPHGTAWRSPCEWGCACVQAHRRKNVFSASNIKVFLLRLVFLLTSFCMSLSSRNCPGR